MQSSPTVMPRYLEPSISSCVRVHSLADFAMTPFPVMLMSRTLFKHSTDAARVPTVFTCRSNPRIHAGFLEWHRDDQHDVADAFNSVCCNVANKCTGNAVTQGEGALKN